MVILNRIRRAALRGALRFTQKARDEMREDDLTPEDVRESLVTATRIEKVIRSRSAARRSVGEKLYVIKSYSFSGTPIYTKGTFRKDEDSEIFYILVSAKISTSAFTITVDQPALMAGACVAALIGVFGALPPALKGARMDITAALHYG